MLFADPKDACGTKTIAEPTTVGIDVTQQSPADWSTYGCVYVFVSVDLYIYKNILIHMYHVYIYLSISSVTINNNSGSWFRKSVFVR